MVYSIEWTVCMNLETLVLYFTEVVVLIVRERETWFA